MKRDIHTKFISLSNIKQHILIISLCILIFAPVCFFFSSFLLISLLFFFTKIRVHCYPSSGQYLLCFRIDLLFLKLFIYQYEVPNSHLTAHISWVRTWHCFCFILLFFYLLISCPPPFFFFLLLLFLQHVKCFTCSVLDNP